MLIMHAAFSVRLLGVKLVYNRSASESSEIKAYYILICT